MANGISDQFAYVLSDITGMMLETAQAAPTLRGEGKISIDVLGLPVEFKPKVVSSIAGKDCHMLIVRIAGNLAMLASAIKLTGDLKLKARITLINLAKFGASPTRWLELEAPRTHDEALKRMPPKAAVATFARVELNRWERIEA